MRAGHSSVAFTLDHNVHLEDQSERLNDLLNERRAR